MASTRIRSFVKGTLWEVLGIFILRIISGSWKVSLAYIGIRIFLYFFYERIWKRIRWGKYNNCKECEYVR